MWMYGLGKMDATPASTFSINSKCRGWLRSEPPPGLFMTGRQLKLELVATGVQLRVQLHERGGVPRRVHLGKQSDKTVLGVSHKRPQVFNAVEAGLRFLRCQPTDPREDANPGRRFR